MAQQAKGHHDNEAWVDVQVTPAKAIQLTAHVGKRSIQMDLATLDAVKLAELLLSASEAVSGVLNRFDGSQIRVFNPEERHD